MAMMILDANVEERLKAERAATGADRYDEVWDGVYVVGVFADNEHQDVQAGLSFAMHAAFGLDSDVRIFAGANVSDRSDGWLHEHRGPDIVVVLPGSVAQDRGTHFQGGPDFLAEIISRGDRSRDKLDFYAGIGVRELLVVDRDPWSLELYRLGNGRLELIGQSHLAQSATLKSEVVPVSFRLIDGNPRPRIEVTHHDGAQRWIV